LSNVDAGDASSYTYTGAALIAGHSYHYTIQAVSTVNPAISQYSPATYFSIASNTPCTITNPPPAGSDTYSATCYLMQLGILELSQDGIVNGNPITRQDLAKISFKGVFGAGASSSFADMFPNPFLDLQQINSAYHNYAIALSYLEYQDDPNARSPFSRDRINFLPMNKIEKVLVLKVLLETFNIQPYSTGTKVFPNDPAVQSSAFYGYIKAAADLGIVNTANTYFNPLDYCTRDAAFIMLWRILSKPSIPKPIPTNDDFFKPGNYTPANLSASKGIETGNFNHYTKTSFTIPGRNVSMDFEHTYNSYETELPDELYTLQPLGKGWSHTYNIYLTSYNPDPSTTDDDRLIIHWADGTLNFYKVQGNGYVPETQGVYDVLTIVSSTEVQIKKKNQVVFTFNQIGNYKKIYHLTSVKDRNNNALSIVCVPGIGDIPRVEYVMDPAGRKLNFTYLSGTNLLQQVSDPLPRTINFNYTSGRLTNFTDAKKQSTTYIYGTSEGESDLLKQIKLPKGNIITNEYFQRKLTSTKYNNNNPTTVNITTNYASASASDYTQSLVKDEQNRQFTFKNNANSMLTSLSGQNINISSQYNATHTTMPSQVTNAVSGITVSVPSYDAVGNPLQITTSGGGLTLNEYYQYNALNDVTQYKNANDKITNFTYTNGNLTKITDPLYNETKMEYNSYGQLQSTTNPANVIVNYGYNGFGNVNKISIPTLNISSDMTYDNSSRMTKSTNFNGQSSEIFYDNNDNITKVIDAMKYETNYGFDANDNLLSVTNAKKRTTMMEYFFDTDWLKSTSFEGASKSYTYNTDGSLNTFTNPNGQVSTNTYDAAGRLTGDGYATYSYDASDRLSTITHSGKTITMSYGALNRVSSVAYSDFAGNTIQYAYDKMGNLTTLTYPGNKAVNYTYDANNQMKTVTDWNTNVTTYNYRTDGQLSDMIYPNGVKCVYTYDNAARLTGTSYKRNNGAGSVIAEYAYTLDNLGNHLSENMTEPYTTYPALTNGTTANTFNNANRILTAGNINFGYDNNGNTTSKTGNTYAFDIQDNLTTVTGTTNITNEYDGSGNRRSTTRNSAVVRFVLDIQGMSRILAETDASGTVQNYYVYGLGMISRIKPDNTTHYYIYNNTGSTVAMVDATTDATITHKYAYTAFGEVSDITEADFNPFRYVGAYGVMYETNDLYFMRARHYNPQIGRFLSEDPIWSTNLYVYGGNNPINQIDPKGLKGEFIVDDYADISQSEVRDEINNIENLLSKQISQKNREKLEKILAKYEKSYNYKRNQVRGKIYANIKKENQAKEDSKAWTGASGYFGSKHNSLTNELDKISDIQLEMTKWVEKDGSRYYNRVVEKTASTAKNIINGFFRIEKSYAPWY